MTWTALGQAANAESDVETERTGRNCFDLDRSVFAQAHDRALAEIPLNLAQRRSKSLILIHRSTLNNAKRRASHDFSPYFTLSRATQRTGSRDQCPFIVLILFSFRFALVKGQKENIQ
jgi:hypothetical protein